MTLYKSPVIINVLVSCSCAWSTLISKPKMYYQTLCWMTFRTCWWTLNWKRWCLALGDASESLEGSPWELYRTRCANLVLKSCKLSCPTKHLRAISTVLSKMFPKAADRESQNPEMLTPRLASKAGAWAVAMFNDAYVGSNVMQGQTLPWLVLATVCFAWWICQQSPSDFAAAACLPW